MRIILILCFLCGSMNIFPLSLTEKENIRSDISLRIQNILNGYDKNTTVDLNINFNSPKEETKLQENPFLLAPIKPNKKINIQDYILSINLTIFSKIQESKFPKTIKASIIEILYLYSNQNRINFKYLKPDSLPIPIVKKIDMSLSGQYKNLNVFEKYFIIFSSIAFLSWVIISLMGVILGRTSNTQKPSHNPLYKSLEKLTNTLEQYFSKQYVTPVPLTKEETPTGMNQPHLELMKDTEGNLGQFCFTDENEENIFFSNNPEDYSLIQSFPSLGWLTLLPYRDVQQILSQFTAKELSIAWVGPQPILRKLENTLPLEKKEQLELYCSQVTSKRDNVVFDRILKLSEEQLKNKKSRKAS